MINRNGCRTWLCLLIHNNYSELCGRNKWIGFQCDCCYSSCPMEGLNLERDDLLCFTNILPASTKYCALQVSQQGFMSVKESKSKQFHKNTQINTKKDLCGDSGGRIWYLEKKHSNTTTHARCLSRFQLLPAKRTAIKPLLGTFAAVFMLLWKRFTKCHLVCLFAVDLAWKLNA